MRIKERTKGEKFRPVVTVLKAKNGEPVVVEIGGVRFEKRTHEDKKQHIKWRESEAKREVLIKLLNHKGIKHPKANQMKIQDLEKMLLENC